jgi:hypothetical protein
MIDDALYLDNEQRPLSTPFLPMRPLPNDPKIRHSAMV